MPNILTIPNSSTIFFSSDTAGVSTSPALSGNAVSLAHNGAAGLIINSVNTSSLTRLQINGANGSLFAVTDAVTGTVFTVNDASGLPIVSVDSALNDVITMGTYGSNALVVRNNRVGVGNLNPDTSAALDISSTVRGFLPPRMTTAQRDAISAPVEGLQIYNTSTNRPNVRSVVSSVATWLEVPAVTTNVASFLTSPTSSNLAAAVSDETGSGALVFANSPTITAPTIEGAAVFNGATRPTSAGTGTPAATSLITLTDARDFLANPSSVILREDFANISTANNQIGELGWVELGTGTGQTMGAPNSPAPNIGIRRLTSGSTAAGNGKVIYLNRIIPIGSVNWEICWVAALVQTTDCDMIVGLTNDNAGIGITRFGGKSMGARYSSAVDTNFMFFSKNTDLDWAANDANNFSVSSGVAVNTTYNTFRLRNVNGVYSASINGGSFVTITNTLTSITSNVMIPFFYIATRTTANKSLDADYFSCVITGLSR